MQTKKPDIPVDIRKNNSLMNLKGYKQSVTDARLNDLAGIISGLIMYPNGGVNSGNNINNLHFLRNQLRGDWLTLDRNLCSLLYSQFGICQAIAEVPVRDAYRNGVRLQVFSKDITPSKDLDVNDNSKHKPQGLLKAIGGMLGLSRRNENDDKEKNDKKDDKNNAKVNPLEQELIRKRQEWSKIAKELDERAKTDTETNLRVSSPRWKVRSLEISAKENNIFQVFEQAEIWKRVFGGAGIIINTPESAGRWDEPLDLNRLKKGDRVDFIVADCWELMGSGKKSQIETTDLNVNWFSECPFTYYGYKIHKSRVLLFKGKELPSMYRALGRGFGLSYYEHIVRSLNKAYKAQNSRAELLDDAKTDIVKFQGLKDMSLNPAIEQGVRTRIGLMQRQKNYSGMVALDGGDDYTQKQISFSNFAEMQADDRIDIASDTRIQLTKLFGMTPAGFNSGDADRATYEDMVRAEVQIPAIPNLITVYKILGRIALGENIDVDVDFNPLTKANDKDTEEIKEMKLRRGIKLWGYGAITDGQLANFMNENDLGDGIEFTAELPLTPEPLFIKNTKNMLYEG